jgi:hypothetical protein
MGKHIQIRLNTRLICFSNKSWEQAEDFVFVCEMSYLGYEVRVCGIARRTPKQDPHHNNLQKRDLCTFIFLKKYRIIK